MSTAGLVEGVPKLPHIKGTCSVCIAPKQTKDPISKKARHRASRPFELMHSGVWGPIRVSSLMGNQYLLTIIDDFSRYTWVFFLRTKAEVYSSSRIFVPWLKTSLVPPSVPYFWIGVVSTPLLNLSDSVPI